MDFEDYCQTLELTETELGVPPKKISTLSKDQLAKIPDLINSRYKKLALKHHPDKKGGDNDKFTKLSKAHVEATKFIEDLIKAKDQNRQAQTVPSTSPETSYYDWFSYFANNTSRPQASKQTNPGNPRNWYYYNENASNYFYDENFSHSSEQEKSYYQTNEPDDWFSYLNGNIFSHYRKTQIEIEKFQEKIRDINQNLEKEYRAEEDKIYHQAFQRYQLKKYSYYHEYKKNQYQDYVTQFSHSKIANKNNVLKIYDPLIARSNVWINLGFAFCFLGFPLILSLFQWQNKKKLETERERLLQATARGEPLGMVEWQQAHGISQYQWEQKFGFTNVEQFKTKYNTTLEGIDATNSVRILHTQLLEKKRHNLHIGEEVKAMQRKVSEGENRLIYHLMHEDKPQHASPTKTERRSYGFKM